jgi:hypothetical protein
LRCPKFEIFNGEMYVGGVGNCGGGGGGGGGRKEKKLAPNLTIFI